MIDFPKTRIEAGISITNVVLPGRAAEKIKENLGKKVLQFMNDSFLFVNSNIGDLNHP